MSHRLRLWAALLLPSVAGGAPVFLENQFELPDGFRIYRAATAELSGGSYDLAFDGQGRLLVGDGTTIRRLNDADGDGVFDSFEAIASGLGWRGPQGILVYGDRLYAVGGDGMQLYEGYGSASGLVHKGRIGQPFSTGGDHDAHTILRGHDGFLYFISGDGGGTRDRLHITESNSPVRFERAASVFRISPDGKHWECVSAGGRNPPNVGQNYLGDLFSFDSDMEWHVGLPFWRPVRLNHWLTGADLGWNEVGALPPYYIDTIPGVLEVGRGSPTWGVFYEHTQLPPRFRDAFLVCDYRWKRESDDRYATSGRLVSFFLTRAGPGWKATMETLVRPKPEARDETGKPISFALVDVEVAPDGSLFLSDHNQGIWRLTYGPTVQPFAKMAGSLPAEPLEALSQLPQPASEWSRLAEEELKRKIPWRAGMERLAVDASRPVPERLRAVRILAWEFKSLSDSFVRALAKDLHPELRGRAAFLLGLRGGDQSARAIATLLRDSDAFVRRCAAEAAERVPEVPAPALIGAMADSERLVRYAAMSALAHHPTAEWFDSAATHPNLQVRMRGLVAAKTRRELPETNALRVLVLSLLRDPRLAREGRELPAQSFAGKVSVRPAGADLSEDRLDFLRILGLFRERLGPEETGTVREFLLRTFPSLHPDISFEQVRLLGEYEVGEAFPKLLQALETEPDHVRQFHIAQAIAKLPTGWSEAAERRLLEWFLKQQTGWFAEFQSKGVEFPQFWATVLADFAKHHERALLNAGSRVDLTGLLGGAYLDVLATTTNGIAVLIALHDQPGQKREAQARIARRLAQEPKSLNARHGAVISGAFLESDDRELLRTCIGFLSRNEPRTDREVESLAERAVMLLETERSLFRPLNELLASTAKRANFPGRGSERIEPAVREQNLVFWKEWFQEQFKRAPISAAPGGKEHTDEEMHRLILASRMDAGNAARGAHVYERLQCHTCHGGGVNPGREGRIFGPDLAGVARRLNRQELADALVYPSRQVPDRFKAFAMILKDATELTGFITEQNAAAVTFVERDQVRTIPRKEIESLSPQRTSLMPEKLVNRLTEEELADLLAFLAK
jgi:putative heme-binding domain-containing protein